MTFRIDSVVRESSTGAAVPALLDDGLSFESLAEDFAGGLASSPLSSSTISVLSFAAVLSESAAMSEPLADSPVGLLGATAFDAQATCSKTEQIAMSQGLWDLCETVMAAQHNPKILNWGCPFTTAGGHHPRSKVK